MFGQGDEEGMEMRTKTDAFKMNLGPFNDRIERLDEGAACRGRR